MCVGTINEQNVVIAKYLNGQLDLAIYAHPVKVN